MDVYSEKKNELSGQLSASEEIAVYWQQKFSKDLPVLNFPADYKVSTNEKKISYEVRSHECPWPETLKHQLQQCAMTENVDLFTLMLAIYGVFLYRYTNQKNIIIGSSVTTVYEQNTSTYCHDMLPLHSEINATQSFENYLRQLHEELRQGLEHAAPFSEIVTAILNKKEKNTDTQILQTFFTLQTLPNICLNNKKVESEKQTMQLFADANTAESFILGCQIIETDKKLICQILYNSTLFDHESIIRLTENLHTLTQAIAEDLNKKISEYPLLSTQERQNLLFDWNQTQKNYPRDKSIPQLFMEQVEKTPNSIAVTFGKEQITYKELKDKSDNLATKILFINQKNELDLHRGENRAVGVLLGQGIGLVISILAIYKSKCTYLPLDIEIPDERLVYILQDSKTKLIITTLSLRDRLNKYQHVVLDIDAEMLEKSTISSELLSEISVQQNDIAYITYTSGTTGKPKGVLSTVKGLLNRLFWCMEHYYIGRTDNLLQLAATGFDISIWEILFPLLSGSCLVVAEENKDIQYILNVVQQEKISIVHFTPSLLHTFLSSITKLSPCATIKQIVCGGDRLSEKTLMLLRDKLEVKLHHAYGPTEASISVTHWCLNYNEPATKVLLGKAIANTKLYVLDKQLALVPIGAIGELYISGVSLAKGYLNHPELTSASFIENPFTSKIEKENGYAELYKTGDLVYMLATGKLVYVGRNDNQLKIRGMRVELAGIANSLMLHANIKQALVLVKTRQSNKHDVSETENEEDRKCLIAYYIADNKIPASELIQYLSKSLPNYMIPEIYVYMESFPLTVNGKLDYHQFSNPLLKVNNRCYVAPQTELESKLCEIWQDVLGIERIGINDDFFKLGGDSILSMKAVYLINQALKCKVTMQRTIAALTTDIIAGKDYMPVVPFITNTKEFSIPVFMIHPSMAGCSVYNTLATLLDGSHISIYGVNSYNLYSYQPMLESLDELAAEYTQEMLPYIKEGNAILVGWSLGGILSLLVTQCLQKKGINVLKIVMIDSYNLQELSKSFLSYFDSFGEILKVLPEYSRQYLSQIPDEEHEHYLHAINLEIKMMKSYSPVKYTGKVTLLRAADKPTKKIDKNGWSEWLNDINVKDIDADHYSIMQGANLKIIAIELNSIIKQACLGEINY